MDLFRMVGIRNHEGGDAFGMPVTGLKSGGPFDDSGGVRSIGGAEISECEIRAARSACHLDGKAGGALPWIDSEIIFKKIVHSII